VGSSRGERYKDKGVPPVRREKRDLDPVLWVVESMHKTLKIRASLSLNKRMKKRKKGNRKLPELVRV